METVAFVDLLDGGAPIDVIAEVRFLPTVGGGKSRPVRANYRPNHNFGGPGNREFFIGQLEIEADQEIAPGETRDVQIRFLSGAGLKQLLVQGREWRIQEGSKLVAFARVLQVVSTP